MLRASLKKIVPPVIIETALETLGFAKSARPQELTLADFSALFHILQRYQTALGKISGIGLAKAGGQRSCRRQVTGEKKMVKMDIPKK